MPSRSIGSSDLEDRLVERLSRRIWPIFTAVVFVALGSAYFFRWAPVIRHTPSSWISPGDLWDTYGAAIALAHGHLNAVYTAKSGFLAPPGFLLALLPLAAANNALGTTFIELGKNQQALGQPLTLKASGSPILTSGSANFHGHEYFVHPQAFVILGPLVLALACLSLFAFDALAERLEVSRHRRVVLTLAEAVVLWNVTVFWGHPEDAVAVALAGYALLFALDERFTGAGWLFGAAVAVQPLVIVVFPILVVMAGMKRALGFTLRTIIPAAAVTIAPLASEFHGTVHNLVNQPTYPNNKNDHQTPWTFLAPKLGGRGVDAAVGGGPVRIVVLALAAGIGWWVQRWRERPEMIVWSVALALALRTYTESVTTAYYMWPALAVALVVAARGSRWRFGIAIAIAIAVTVVAQWNLSLWPWWLLNVVGVTGVLVAAAWPEPVNPPAARAGPVRTPKSSGRGGSRPSGSKKKAKRKAARSNRKVSGRR